MGLKCKITYINNIPVATNEAGNPSLLYRDALAYTGNATEALNIWATVSTPEYQSIFGKPESVDDVSLEQVVKFYNASKKLDAKLTSQELFGIKQMMRSNGVSTLSEMTKLLKTVFQLGDVPSYNPNLAVATGLFLPEDLPSLDLAAISDLIVRMEGEILRNDFEIAVDQSTINYKNSGVKNILGASEPISIEQIDAEVLDLIADPQSEASFYDRLRELPYTDFVERFYSDKAFATEYMNRFADVVKIPVVEERNGELVADVTDTFSTVKNTMLDGLDSLDIDTNIAYLESIPDTIWEQKLDNIKNIIVEIETELATKNIDIVGLNRISTDKTTILALLQATSTMVLNPSDVNIEVFSQIYDSTFLKTPTTSVQRLDKNLQGLTVIKMHSSKTPQELFDQHGLIAVGDNLYQKVVQDENVGNLYEYLYQQMQDGNFKLPYQFSLEKDMANKPAVLKDIEKYVNSRDTGLGFYNEKVSLYQLIFKHPVINRSATAQQDAALLNTLATKEDYLRTDFVSDFYNYILQEKLKDSEIYRNTLSKFAITDRDITLTGTPTDLKNIEMVQELMDYFKLSTNQNVKKYILSEMRGTASESLAAINFPDLVPEFTGSKNVVGSFVATSPLTDDFIRIGEDTYQKVKQTSTASIFVKLQKPQSSAYYTTRPVFEGYSQETLDRLSNQDMVSMLKKSAADISNGKEKAGMMSTIVNRLLGRNQEARAMSAVKNEQAFTVNLVEFIRAKGIPVVTDEKLIREKLAELGLNSINQMFDFQDMGVNSSLTIKINGNNVTVIPDVRSRTINTEKAAFASATRMFDKIKTYLQNTAKELYRDDMVTRSGNTITLNIKPDLKTKVEALQQLDAEILRIAEEDKKTYAAELVEGSRTEEELERGVSEETLRDLGYNFLQTPQGNILGFEFQGTIYMDPNRLNNNTTIHELIHVFQAMLTRQALLGNTLAQSVIAKREEVFGDIAREWEDFHKTNTDSSTIGLNPIQPGEVIPQFQLGLITLTEQEVLKYGRAGIDNKYEAQAIKQIGLQGINFDKASIQNRINKETEDLLKRTTDYVFSEDSKAIDGAIQNEIDTMINQGSPNEQIEQAKKALQPGAQRDSVINAYKKAQLDTIKQWTDYLSQSDYSDAFKYLILDAVLTNNYNFKTDEYQKRNKKTIRNFTPFDAGTLAELYTSESNSLLKDYVKIQVENTANIVENSKFSSTGEGEWLKFAGGSDISSEELSENANKLSQLVQNTYWCTKTNAKSQLEDGDFYVYTTKNTDGSYSPRVAVRMEGDTVGEVRGNASSKQDIEPEMLPVAEKFLKEEIPNNSGKKWLDSIAYNTKVKDYTEKIKGKTLNLDDIQEYVDILKDAKKYSVDYGENGLVTALEDVFKTSEFSVPVAFKTREINEDTIAFIGDASFGSQITDLGALKIITGVADFSSSEVRSLGQLQSIGGDAYFIDSRITNLGLLENIGGDAIFNNSYITDLGALKSIGGAAYFNNSNVESLGSLESIGTNVRFADSIVTDLGSLRSVGGFADFSNARLGSLGSLENIGKGAIFSYSDITTLGSLESIGGFADFTGSKVQSLGSLRNIGDDAFFADSLITSLGSLQSIGGSAMFSRSKVASLGSLKRIGKNAIFSYSDITTLGSLESIGSNVIFSDSIVTDLGLLRSIGGEASFSNAGLGSLGLLENIGGDAIFTDSGVRNLGSLKSIGANAFFNGSIITDLGSLKSIGGSAIFRDSNVENLGDLETIGTQVWFGDKIKDLGKLQPVARGRATFDGNPALKEQYNQRVAGKTVVGGSPLFQFAGEGNKLSFEDTKALEQAKQLEADNKTPEEIYQQTNWLKTSQGTWIREIGDLQVIPFTEKELEEEVGALYSQKESIFALNDLFDTAEIGNRYNFSKTDVVLKFKNGNESKITARAVRKGATQTLIEVNIQGTKDTLRKVLGGENIGDNIIRRRVRSGETIQLGVSQTLESIVNHEFQHILQAEDNTRKQGNSLYAILDFFARKNESAITALGVTNYKDLAKALGDIYGKDDFIGYAETLYRNSIGERQATEVERRMFDKSTLPENFEGAFNVDIQDVIGDQAMFQIAGENANLTQGVLEDLQVAKRMETADKTPAEIRLATGWEKGSDGKWRFETPDNLPFLKDTVRQLKAYLFEENLDNVSQKANYFLPQELLDLYPQLKDVKIQFNKKGNENSGSYDKTTNQIDLNIGVYPQNTVSVLLHEIQHVIQNIEGFPTGGNPAAMTTKDEALQFLVANLPELTREQKSQLRASFKNQGLSISTNFYFDVISDDSNKLEDVIAKLEIMDKAFSNKDYQPVIDALDFRIMEMGGTDVAFEKYQKLAGEVEARNVERRMNMSPEQRRQTLLSQTEDIAREDQVMFQVDAYHGSPYSFDKFTTQKMGTGEGAQAFGWGLYFTDIKSIAENYADAVGKMDSYLANAVDESQISEEAKTLAKGHYFESRDRNEAVKLLQYNKGLSDNKGDFDQAITFLKRFNPPRNLYKVSLHQGKSPSEYAWLEWDMPISNKLVNIFQKFNKEQGIKLTDSSESVSDEDRINGGQFYKWLSNKIGDKETSLFLLENGIDGVKYPAESISRGATSETARGFNYVVFDENAISIDEVVQFQMIEDLQKTIGLNLKSAAYAPRVGETDAAYHSRILTEVEAYIVAPETAANLARLQEENPSLWTEITKFIKNLTEWLKSQIGLLDYKGDVMSMTQAEYTSALGISVLKDPYSGLSTDMKNIPNLQTADKISNDMMNQSIALDSQLEILSLQTEEDQEAILDKIDNCG